MDGVSETIGEVNIFKRLKSIFRASQGPKEGVSAHPERVDGVKYEESPRFDRFIFICGLHRSGTTLLERLMAVKAPWSADGK